MTKVSYCYLAMSLTLLLLGGCTSSPVKKSLSPPVPVKPQAVVKPMPTAEQTIKKLLEEADYALSHNQLLMPLQDNAYDRYQAVLLLDKNNTQAKTGLQAISLRYVELARTATAHSRYREAQGYLNNARDVDPGNPVVAEFAATLRKQITRQKSRSAYKPGVNEHLLDATELSNQSEVIITQLAQLAQQAKKSGDLVMIHARNDAEGRWIYRKMRDALPGFLLRGDIKISRQPRIEFVPRLQ